MNKSGFQLTRQAAETLRNIHAQSLKQWGQKTADDYMAALYAAIGKAAAKPEIGQLRAHRAMPFLMIAAEKHFIVYDRLKDGVIIIAILHQRRNIEQIIASMDSSVLAEIDALRRKFKP
jgi:plasmid stabilization system protein ParE